MHFGVLLCEFHINLALRGLSNRLSTYVRYTLVKVDGAVQASYRPVSKRARYWPVFRSLNISTFHGLKTCNGPIIFTGPLYNEPVITGTGPVTGPSK